MISLHVESKIWHKWTYLQDRNRLTDTENRLMGDSQWLGLSALSAMSQVWSLITSPTRILKAPQWGPNKSIPYLIKKQQQPHLTVIKGEKGWDKLGVWAEQIHAVCVCVCVLSRVQLFATPWPVPARLLCPWNFLGKDTGVRCHFPYSRRSSWPRDGTHVSCVSCTGRRLLYQCSIYYIKHT